MKCWARINMCFYHGNFRSEFNFKSELQSVLHWSAERLGIPVDKTLSLSALFDSLIKDAYIGSDGLYYLFGLPNFEVQKSLNEAILNTLTDKK